MKLNLSRDKRRARRRQTGSAVIIILALLALMLIYIAANSRTLFSLGQELKLLERQQIHRLETTTAKTNATASATLSTNDAQLSATRPANHRNP